MKRRRVLSPEPSPNPKGPSIRPLRADDRSSILAIVASTGNFKDAEVDVALELVDSALKDGERSGYLVSVLESGFVVEGYACYGPTPLTEGTWDLYWIAVKKDSQGKGYGRALLGFAEDEVRRRRGRLLLIETSSQESYGGTRSFYERAGYRLAAVIPDFYRPGDDKLVFLKLLSGT